MAIRIEERSVGILTVSAKYLHKIKGSDNFYFIRRLPAAVSRAYKARGEKPKAKVVITTGTANRQRALGEAYRINNALEAGWDAIVKGRPTASDVSDGHTLLKQYLNQPYDLSDYLDDKLSYQAKQSIHQTQNSLMPKEIQREAVDAILREQLSDAEWQAVMLARGKAVWTLSIIKEEYLKLKGWVNDRKQRNSVDGAFNTMIEAFGDITPNSISRLETHQLVKALVDNGLKTASVKRKLSVVRAAINYVSKLQEIQLNNPFANVDIPNLLEDAHERQDFTHGQLETLREKLRTANKYNEIDGIIGLLMDTGMRISEAVGLQSEDIVLDAEVPHIKLYRNTMRRLKTKNSKRLIPLVGASLLAAHRLKEGCKTTYLLDRYVDTAKGVLKNDSASAAVNKRLRAWLGVDAPTCHSFRHTLNTRLRNAGCPKDIREELGGWAKSISDSYGSPHDLTIKQDYLKASC